MSTSRSDARRSTPLPPLVAGQRLDRASFHERYEAMPPETRAELVGGVVYLPSPLGCEHGERDSNLGGWLTIYRLRTPGLRQLTNATVQFDDYGEPQPDFQLRIPEERGGRSRIVGRYIVGPPELIVEVADSSRSVDLGAKKADYERAGVLEYVVSCLDPDAVRWFVLRDGRYAEQRPGDDGIYRSEVFPGLWLDPDALAAGDLVRLIATLERGLTTPEHAAFVAPDGLTDHGRGGPCSASRRSTASPRSRVASSTA